MHDKKIILFLICFFITGQILSVQPLYNTKYLGLDKGLSNNYVMSIAQDKRGFIWVATEEGLNQFDGNKFYTFFKNENTKINGITGNELNFLLDDTSDSIMWIATQRAGLNAYNYSNFTFKSYLHDEKDPKSIGTNDVTSILHAEDSNIWITTYWLGIEYFNKKDNSFTHYNTSNVNGLVSNGIWSIAEKDGFLYAGHVRNGFSIISVKERWAKNYIYNPNDISSLPNNNVYKIFKDDSGNIWVGTAKGLALFDRNTEKFLRIRGAEQAIFDIKQDDNKLLIACEFGGVKVLNLRPYISDSLTNIKIDLSNNLEGFTNSTIKTIFQDRYKNIWLGIWGGGIAFLPYELPTFDIFNYFIENGSSENYPIGICHSICFDAKGNMWVGTDNNGVNVFQNKYRVNLYNKARGNIKDNTVQTEHCDSNGNMWIGTYLDGLYYYNALANKFQQIPLIYGDNNHDVRDIFEDSNKILWIATSSGIFKVDIKTLKCIEHIDVGNNLTRCITKDSNNNIWIGTFGSGLYRISGKNGKVSSFNNTNGFPSNSVDAVLCDNNNRLLAGSAEGLVIFKDTNSDNYINIGRSKGIANPHIRAIVQDENKNIWVSTNNGISVIKAEGSDISNYGHLDNIPLGNFLGNSVAKDEKGNIYFGSINGICRFSPSKVLSKREAPFATITKLNVLGAIDKHIEGEESFPLKESQTIILDHTQNSFSISFSVLNYALNDGVEYAYMLKGLDDNWYTVYDPENVSFRNILPGTYTFMVKTRMHNQEWSSEYSTIKIIINPPFWLSWWAKSIYVILSLAFLFILLYAYNRRLKAEALYKIEKNQHEQEQNLNNERQVFFTNITHELRTPLTLILGPLEDMQSSNNLCEPDAKKISVIHKSALRLLHLINQILEFRKTETQNRKLCVANTNLSKFLKSIGIKYVELNRNKNINFILDIEYQNIPIYFDKEVLTIILDNLIINAFKYTDNGSITLSLKKGTRLGVDYIDIRVTDTGYGISEEALPHIFGRYYQEKSEKHASGTGIGLALVQNLIKLHEAEITVESKRGEGTSFCVSLLANNTYPDALHEDIESEPEQIREDNEEEIDVSGKRIMLIVEDNPEICDYIVESFSEYFEVRVAENGKIGLETALSSIPDIIVSDIMMPVMDGIEMCIKLKENINTCHIPIIMLTANDSILDKERGYKVGADSYLTKPFSATLLHSRINNILEMRKKLADSVTSKDNILNTKKTILTDSMNKIDSEFLQKINSLIEARLSSEKISIDYISENTFMSSSTLYRKMKALTGLSTNEYIRKVKMRHVEKLLLEGKYNITEISYMVGFSALNYFRQCFKEEFGLTPSDYLKKIKGCDDN